MGALGFADDIIILAKENIGASRMFETLVQSLDILRMSISIRKCEASEVKKVNKSWFIQDPNISYRSKTIPYYNEGGHL